MVVENDLCGYELSRSALPARKGFDFYKCREQRESAKSRCIFHDLDPRKDAEELSRRLYEKRDSRYIGYVFPESFTFTRFKLQGADFAHCQFLGTVDFQGSVFRGHTDFSFAIFDKGAHFRGARFKGSVNFTGALFRGQAWFNDATLDSCVNLTSAHFKDEFWFAGIGDAIADMTGTIFEKDAHFHNTFFAGASFIETQFGGQATFGFYKYIAHGHSCEQASTSPDIVFFEGVDMSRVLFREANLKRASFNQCYNLDQARFFDCTWNLGYGRNNILYDELELRKKMPPWEKMAKCEGVKRKCGLLGDASELDAQDDKAAESRLERSHASVEETCRAFKKHFEDRRNYLVAGDFHEGEMEMRRLAKGTWGRRLLSIEAVYWLLSRYGQSWLRPLACFIALNLIAAVIYSFSGLQLESERAPMRLEITAEPSPILMLESLFIYLHAFLYSFSVSALLRGVYATPTSLVGLLLQTVQFILGPLLILLIGLAIRRRVRR